MMESSQKTHENSCIKYNTATVKGLNWEIIRKYLYHKGRIH